VIGPFDLIFAFFLDLAIGDPGWLPHPVRIIGRGISRMENFLRRHFSEAAEKTAGIFLVISIVIPVAVTAFLLQEALLWSSTDLSIAAGMIVLVYLVSSTLAHRELRDSAQLVIESVKDGALEASRRKLSMIVGRDTENLSEQGVLRATIETLAENLSDGIVAPIFYLAIGGLPLAMAYKAINTLDSMVGYKNERYTRFGWASARLDDIANYIPARITGALIVASAFLYWLMKESHNSLRITRHAWRTMLRDGRKHSSPNSGIPEAAMAGALGVRLGGSSTYGGIIVEKPYIGDSISEDYLAASERAIAMVSLTSLLAVSAAVVILGLRSIL
jgi:adenosylcobinamide-phosphate synthase